MSDSSKRRPGSAHASLCREFLKRPNPHKMLLVNDKKTELYSQLVLKTRKIKALEAKVNGLSSPIGGYNVRKEDRVCKLLDQFAIALESEKKGTRKAQMKTIISGAKDAVKALRNTQKELKELKSCQKVDDTARYYKRSIAQMEEIINNKEQLIISQQKQLEALSLRQTRIRDALQITSVEFNLAVDDPLLPKNPIGFCGLRVGRTDATISSPKTIGGIPSRGLHDSAFRNAFLAVTADYTETHKKLVEREKELAQLEEDHEKAKQELASLRTRLSRVNIHPHAAKKIAETNKSASAVKSTNEKTNEQEPVRRSSVRGRQLFTLDQTPTTTKATTSTVPDEGQPPPHRNLHLLKEFPSIISNTAEEEYRQGKPSYERDISRTKGQVFQMRLLLEMLKNLYLDERVDMQALNARFESEDNTFFSKALAHSEEDVMNAVQVHGAKCVSVDNLRLYILNEEQKSLWTKAASSEFEIVVSLNKIPTKALCESDVASVTYQTREAIHVLHRPNSRVNFLGVPVFDSTAHKNVIGVLVASKKNHELLAHQTGSILKPLSKTEIRANKHLSEFTEFDEAVITILADHVGCVLQHINFEKARFLKRRYSHTLRALPKELHVNLLVDSPILFGTRLEAICCKLSFAKSAKVFMVDIRQPKPTVWASRPVTHEDTTAQAYVHYPLTAQTSIATSCILNATSELSLNAYDHEFYNANIDIQGDRSHKPGSLICVPIQLPQDAHSYFTSFVETNESFKSVYGKAKPMGCIQLLFAHRESKQAMIHELEDALRTITSLMQLICPQVDLMWQALVKSPMLSSTNGERIEYEKVISTQREQIQCLQSQKTWQEKKIQKLQKQLQASNQINF